MTLAALDEKIADLTTHLGECIEEQSVQRNGKVSLPSTVSAEYVQTLVHEQEHLEQTIAALIVAKELLATQRNKINEIVNYLNIVDLPPLPSVPEALP